MRECIFRRRSLKGRRRRLVMGEDVFVTCLQSEVEDDDDGCFAQSEDVALSEEVNSGVLRMNELFRAAGFAEWTLLWR